jgi:hypothetical protein
MQLSSLSTKTKVIAGSAAAGLALAFYQFVPRNFWPVCPIHATTGLYCTGCGGQRWLSSLLHGNFEAAWHYNQLLSISPAIFAIYLVVLKVKTGRKTQLILLGALLALIAAFTIWRNFAPQVQYLQH